MLSKSTGYFSQVVRDSSFGAGPKPFFHESEDNADQQNTSVMKKIVSKKKFRQVSKKLEKQ